MRTKLHSYGKQYDERERYTSYPMNLFGYENKSVEEVLLAVDKVYSKESQKKYGGVGNYNKRSDSLVFWIMGALL